MVAGFLVAFVLSWLPEPVKGKGWFQQFNSPAVHVVSGLVELLAGTGLLFVTFLRSMDEFNTSFALALARGKQCIVVSETDLRGAGLLGFVGFLVHPLSFVCYAMIAEGLARGLTAFLTGKTPGTLLLSIPRTLLLQAKALKQKAFRRAALGPSRPDEIRPDQLSPSGLLEILSAGEKPWHEHQALELDGRFYLLDNRQWIRRGEHWSICYRFRPMEKGEIIRGSLVRY